MSASAAPLPGGDGSESLRAVSRAPLVVEKVLIWIKETLNVGYCRMTGDGLVYKS